MVRSSGEASSDTSTDRSAVAERHALPVFSNLRRDKLERVRHLRRGNAKTCYHLIRCLCRLDEPTPLLCKTSGTATAVRSSNKSRPHSTSRVQPDYLVSLSMANSVRLPLRA